MLDVMESKDFFEAQAKALHAASTRPAWLSKLQQDALATFAEKGWPTTRQEAWRFTPLRPITKASFTPAPENSGEGVAAHVLEEGSLVLAFVNGTFRKELSRLEGLPEGVTLRSLSQALGDEDITALEPHLGRVALLEANPLAVLNLAMCDQGVVLHLAAGTHLEQPVEIVHYNEGEGTFASAPRHLIVAEQGSQCSVVETYVGNAAAFTNTVTEVVAEKGARVHHYFRDATPETACHVHHFAATLSDESHLESHGLLTGGALVRNSARVTFNGEGAHASIGGLFVGHGEQLHDNHITMDHAKGHNTSDQFFKGVLDDKAKGVFTSRVIVRKDAQKTDSRQSNRNLLLSDRAKVDTQPQLEIYADDVKCAHGATTGQIDEDALFYMQARGLPPERARVLLLYAFAHEVIDRIPLASLRQQAETFLLERFAAGSILGEEA